MDPTQIWKSKTSANEQTVISQHHKQFTDKALLKNANISSSATYWNWREIKKLGKCEACE